MANDSKQKELLKKLGIQQLIPYIYKFEEFYYCLYHLGLKPLKLGNMIKHAHGHHHRTEWEHLRYNGIVHDHWCRRKESRHDAGIHRGR